MALGGASHPNPGPDPVFPISPLPSRWNPRGRSPEHPRGSLTVLVAAVPGAIHGAVGEDAQEMSPVAAVQQFGFLVVARGQVELFRQRREGGDLPLGHPLGCKRGDSRGDTELGTRCCRRRDLKAGREGGREPGGRGGHRGQVIHSPR